MRITILRHAPTAGNMLSQYIGRTDQPLSPEGRALAQCSKKNGAVKIVYTSTLRRTIETAEILYPNAKIRAKANLAEMDFGNFERKNWQELENNREYSDWLATNCESRCPGGESKEEFTKRCRTEFQTILHEEFEQSAKELYLVVHGGVIMSILSGFVEPEQDYFSWKAGFCGGYILGCASLESPRSLAIIETIESSYQKELT